MRVNYMWQAYGQSCGDTVQSYVTTIRKKSGTYVWHMYNHTWQPYVKKWHTCVTFLTNICDKHIGNHAAILYNHTWQPYAKMRHICVTFVQPYASIMRKKATHMCDMRSHTCVTLKFAYVCQLNCEWQTYVKVRQAYAKPNDTYVWLKARMCDI